ncbi:MAG TPA: SurA N-terminal domain-containing protein [Pyrinomonadaceae bacterium]|jgi:peptidyl-prolyl cis-trans isomerase D|nr:SurA N-terminal domain-containing protein [Pyrinomonadaceae bacterium]
MLKQLSKFERTSKVLILGFVALMAISLVLFFRPGGSSSAVEPTKNNDVVASVNGEDITLGEFATQKQNLQMQFSRFGGQISLMQMGYTDDKILDGLIQRKVAVQEARRLGLEASPSEVNDRIRKTFSDAAGKLTLVDSSGKLDMAKYEQRVGDVAAFERGIAEDIAREKLEAFVSASVHISEEDLQSEFKKKNTSFDLTYVIVSSSKLAEKIQPTDDEMKAYFEAHKTDYNILVPQKKIRYVFIDQDKSGQKLQISDKDLHDEYDSLDPKYKEAGVKVQQIVLRVAREDLDASVKTKADGLVTKARAGGETVTEQAFADLAKGNSEDPNTAKNGGWVNGIVKKDATKKDDPYQKVLDMEPGEVTDAIKYKNAYYILRRGDSVPKTFEDAKKEIEVSLRNRRGYTAAQKIAQQVQDRLKEIKDAQKVAQEFAAQANMNAADMVKETPFIKPGDDVPNIGSSQQFEEAIAPLNNPNDVGERVGIKNGFAVPMLVEQKPPRIPDFDEVKDKVRAAVKDEKAKGMLEQKAKEIAAAAKSPGDLKAAAEKAGLEAKAEANYKLSTPLGEAGSSALIDDPLYAAKAGDVLPPIFLNSNYLVIGVNKKTDADLTEYAKQRDSLMQQALSDRKNQVFEDYLTSVTYRMKQAGKIKVYQDVLETMAEDEPQAAPPPRRPQLPVTK